MASPTLTRRTVLNAAALATSALAMPFVHGSYAAGRLSCGFCDADEPLARLCREWADKEKVELTLDFIITSQGDKLALTVTAEAQARSGHDVLQMSDWYIAAQADNLDPVELVTSLIKEHGKLLLGPEYIGRQKGRWIAVPTGVQTTGQTSCARINHFKQFVGLDVTRMYPPGEPPDEALADA